MRGHVIVGVMTISTDVDKLYDTDLTDAAWALIRPMLPAARRGGRPRTTNIRAVLNAIFYLLRTGCQWRLLPPRVSSLEHGLSLLPSLEERWCLGLTSSAQCTNKLDGRPVGPPVRVIMDGQSVKTTERGGIRGFDTHKRVKGRKRQTSAACVQDHRPHLDCSCIIERSFAWLGRNRRLSKDYKYSVQTSETLIDIAATRLILNRLASA